MVHLTISKGDKGYDLTFTVTENDGTAKNLSGYTVTFYCWRPSAPDTYIASGVCALTDAANGECTYTIQAADFTSSSYYEGKLICTSGGIQDSVEGFLIAVPDSAYYCSVSELKDELDISGADHDYQLQALVMQAQKFIDNYTKRTFIVGSSGEVRYFDGSESPIFIDDIVTITSVELDEESDGTYSSSMAATDYVSKPYNKNPKTWLEISANSDYGSFCSGVTKGVKITGTWGYDTAVPEDIRRASIIQCCRWFKRKDSAWASVTGPSEMGPMSITAGLDPDVKEILKPYLRTRIG